MIRFAHHLRMSLGRGALLALALAAPMAHATAAPLALPSPSVAPLQELPIRYAGEGMVILVTSYDEAAGVAAGTLQIGSAAALPFPLPTCVPMARRSARGRSRGRSGRAGSAPRRARTARSR